MTLVVKKCFFPEYTQSDLYIVLISPLWQLNTPETMTSNIFTSLPVTTVSDRFHVPTKRSNQHQAVTVTYDYLIDWIQGEWAGKKSSGWFSYIDSTPYPCLQDFHLMIGGTQPKKMSYSPFGKPPLYWDGKKLAIRDWWGIPSHAFLSKKQGLFSHSGEGYYMSFAAADSGYLINLYTSKHYTYIGSGLVSYKKRNNI